MNERQKIFDAAWRIKRNDGFKKTTPWEGSGIPMKGNGCGCVLEAAREGAKEVMGRRELLEVFFTFDERFKLVEAHSDATSPADMERRLREFAAAHGLTVPGDEKPIPSVDEWARSAVAAVTKYEPYPRLPMGEVLEAKLHRGA